MKRERPGQTLQTTALVNEAYLKLGPSVEEAAEVLGVSGITVKREWSKTKAWLYRELRLRE